MDSLPQDIRSIMKRDGLVPLDVSGKICGVCWLYEK